MKELHLFYAPDLEGRNALPEEEAAHAVRVLRMKEGDTLWATDGKGTFYDCMVTATTGGRRPECFVEVERRHAWQRPWKTGIHLAMAPTKNMDRVEWLAEKATEIGMDSLNFLDCEYSERRVLKTDRVERIVVSATKQSHKAIKPTVAPLLAFKHFIDRDFEGDKFIAHCYPQNDIDGSNAKPHLFEVVRPQHPTLVLVGPEGDFSVEEVRLAQTAGFRSITLGESRLRTETAALVAVQLMNLKKSLC